ncbi:ATP-dependet DEAD/DEAH box helicase [Desulforapulum autotrophicum HRM2]|uniref:ATP-dependet DEAD/DEAH box helicase n=1 Tax=Desulforapulum autotrophicum (strain ATCC 43914 / DSM 3382 / VKM B-1955 / HRM2) TaxID=177437 RepID=C0QCS3_DESAH|nr:DEAD/DEAH box helicase [Desulforapulum autotrophicum]ACN15150.1 ATP-dependet DEAD/DEAH box helicase [Desulforapulum autotrophicum HRM2]
MASKDPMELIVNSALTLCGMDTGFRDRVTALLTMPNPKYADADKQGRNTAHIARDLFFYRENDDGSVAMPRGFLYELEALVRDAGLSLDIKDKRRTLPSREISFYGKLRFHQLSAVKDLLERDFGVSHIPTGGGKTVVALWLIAHRKQPALIVVHTRELLNQWLDRIETFLHIPRARIGIIGNGKFMIGNEVTIATIQSLVRRTDDLVPRTGFLILDECHRVPAMQYIETIKQFDCRYMLGLTATPWRRDRLSKAIFWHIGEITGQIDKKDLLEDKSLCEAEVVWVKTGFNTDIDASSNYSQALSALTRDPHRNRLICDTVLSRTGNGIDLVLSDRREHCEMLGQLLETTGQIRSAVLTGDKTSKQRTQIMRALYQGKITVLIATGQLIGEGFDLPGLTTLYLTTPVKFPGRVIQYVGRILRPSKEKTKATIVDFVDVNNPVFKASATSRFYTYRQQGIVEQHSIE